MYKLFFALEYVRKSNMDKKLNETSFIENDQYIEIIKQKPDFETLLSIIDSNPAMIGFLLNVINNDKGVSNFIVIKSCVRLVSSILY